MKNKGLDKDCCSLNLLNSGWVVVVTHFLYCGINGNNVAIWLKRCLSAFKTVIVWHSLLNLIGCCFDSIQSPNKLNISLIHILAQLYSCNNAKCYIHLHKRPHLFQNKLSTLMVFKMQMSQIYCHLRYWNYHLVSWCITYTRLVSDDLMALKHASLLNIAFNREKSQLN